MNQLAKMLGDTLNLKPHLLGYGAQQKMLYGPIGVYPLSFQYCLLILL
jgi:hypothetical protein